MKTPRLAIVAILVSLAWVGSARALPDLGTEAPAFRLSQVDGPGFELPRGPQKAPVLLAFVSVACQPCEDASPVLSEVAERYVRNGALRVACVALCPEGAARWLLKSGKHPSSVPILVEKIQKNRFVTADSYGVSTTPAFVLVGRDGKVAWRHEGPVTTEAVDKAVRTALVARP
jgi:thiol-disulfide isomerase/thioredoxin